ncbi:LPS export ABC transporter periplasmic protein LptC [Pelagibius sp. CAU 1746]|uniref:LPS export ABC transporter periplasmic protein LptC n=1 Tax=Pelagibius sp. CAU 1746 TaxID=3140370 RepID=UPI00325AE8D7
MAETVVHSSPATARGGAKAPPPPPRNDDRGRQPPRLSGRNSYSLFVSSMKLVLPALAAGLVLLVIAWPQLMPDVSRSGLDFAKIARDHAKTLNMLNARYSGVDENNQPFTVAADLATQSPENEDMVELQHPKADIETAEGDLVALSARVGHYDRKAETLDLTGKVHLTHDKGFDIVTEEATIDLNDGSAAGDAAVSGAGPSGELESEGFRLRERGQIIVFTGKSRLLIYPEAKEKLSEGKGAAGPAEEVTKPQEATQ